MKFGLMVFFCIFGALALLPAEPSARETWRAGTLLVAADETEDEDEEDEEYEENPRGRLDELRGWLEKRHRERGDASPEYNPAHAADPEWTYGLESGNRHASRHYGRRRGHRTSHAWHDKRHHYHHARRRVKHSHPHGHSRRHAVHRRHAGQVGISYRHPSVKFPGRSKGTQAQHGHKTALKPAKAKKRVKPQVKQVKKAHRHRH